MPIIKNGRFITEIRHGTRRIASAYQGTRKIWQEGPIDRPAETAQWFTPGQHNYYVPFWAGYLDVVRLGAGGGGASGDGALAASGSGGAAGAWVLERIDVRTIGARSLLVEVGAGGAEGRSGSTAPGGHGGSSRVYTLSGTIGATAGGGAGGVGSGGPANGGSSGNRELHGRTYTGGTGGAGGSGAGRPGGRGSGGGGGAGGIFGQYREGGRGGDGAVWITAMTRYEVEN